MGLDITAYRGLRKAQNGEGRHPEYEDEVDDEAGYVRLHVNDDFPGRADEIEDRAIYHVEDSFGFRAGAYSGYNYWRDHLAKLAGYPQVVYDKGRLGREASYAAAAWTSEDAPGIAGPFYELINFSDCEGVIGTAVSAKLAREFAEYQPKADAHPDDWFREKYADWRKAFEMAADNGAVSFQ